MYDLALVGVVLVWGLNYVFMKYGLRELDAGVFTLARFLGAAPFLFLILRRSREEWRLPRVDWGRTVAVGLVGTTLYQVVFAQGVGWTSPANASLLFTLSPAFTALLGWTTGQDRPRLRTGMGIAVAFAGAGLVIAGGSNRLSFSAQNLKGDLTMLAAAFLWALYAIVAGPLLKKHSGLKVTAWSALPGTLGLMAFYGAGALAVDWTALSPPTWGSLLYSVVAVTLFGLVMFYQAIPHLGPVKVMAYMYLVPVAAILSGVLFLGQGMTLWQGGGALLAAAGVYLVRTPPERPGRNLATARPVFNVGRKRA